MRLDLLFTVILLLQTLHLFSSGIPDPEIKDPEKHIELFEKITELSFPENAEIIRSYYIAFEDYKFYIVFKADEKTIEDYLCTKPPFSNEWITGPVPGEQCFGITFGNGYTVDGYRAGKAYGDKAILDILNSDNIIFSANGTILDEPYAIDIIFIEKNSNTVWLCCMCI